MVIGVLHCFFFKFVFACKVAVTSSSLYYLRDENKENPFFSLAIESEGFSEFYGYTSSMFPAPSCGRIRKLIGLLLILQHTISVAGSFSFVFLKVILQLKFVVSPLPANSGLFSVCAPFLPELADRDPTAELGEV